MRKTMSGHVLSFQEDDSDTRNKRRLAQAKQSEQEKSQEETKMRDNVYRKLNPGDKRLHKSGVSPRPTIARTRQEDLVLREELEKRQQYKEKCISLYFFS